MREDHRYTFRQKVGLFLIFPVVLSFLLSGTPENLSTEAWNVLLIAVMMAVFWVSECFPIPVTALIPLLLFPFLKIAPFQQVAQNYADSNIFLFMGGFFIAIAMQKWGLHRRIALYLILAIGTSLNGILFGFMVATAILSMWISNTATTMMIYPIGLAVVMHLSDTNNPLKRNSVEIGNLRTALMLAIAYSASIGGIATPIGTPPNIVFMSTFSKLFPDAPAIGFLNWMVIGLTLLVVLLPVCWFVLSKVLFKLDDRKVSDGRDLIRQQISDLGKMSLQEKSVGLILFTTALAWITRRDFVLGETTLTGWGTFFGLNDFIHDGTVAMFATLLLFVIPANFKKGEFLLDWTSAVKIPWGILILFGGGIALSDGFRESGLASWIGFQLSSVGDIPLIFMILLTCFTLTFMTELTSNVATASLFMPILASTALGMQCNPLVLMIPATISASCAFMLPVATPPNAIIFASGYVTIPQMARTGIILNIICIAMITLITYFIVIPVLDISMESPVWAR